MMIALTLKPKNVLNKAKIFRSIHTVICGSVSDSFAEAISEHYSKSQPDSDNSPISVSLAKSQHENYIKKLQSFLEPSVSNITIIPPNNKYPDCVFVEDCVVCIENSALILRPGALSREGEAKAMKETIQQLFSTNNNFQIFDMNEINPDATCDGGDVLVPRGKSAISKHKRKHEHLFVGQSERTNKEGIQILGDIFKSKQVIPVDNSLIKESGTLHLKSIITYIDENTLIAPRSHLGNELIKAMKLKDLGYDVIQVPDSRLCNVVSANENVMTLESECEETKQILEEEIVNKRNYNLHYINLSEFEKADGAGTCCSVLIG